MQQPTQKPAIKIEDIQANYQQIIQLVGNDSFVNWDLFIKTSTDLNKQMEELMRGLTIYRDIQQKRFVNAMKKLKGLDIPDLLKTVKAKKLPKEALRAIANNFEFDIEGKIKLTIDTATLKANSQESQKEYTSVNEQLTKKLKEATDLVALKIQQSGLYQEPAPPKQLVSTFKSHFSQQVLQKVKKEIKVQYMQGTDVITFQTYGQIVHNTFPLVKDQYKRLTTESREKQRSLMKDPKKYMEALIEYLTNTEALILEGQRKLVKAVGLEQKKVEESEVALMEKGLAQSVLLIQSGLRTSVKESVAPTNPVSFDKTQKIIKHQVELVKKKTPFFKEMLKDVERTPENFQIMPLVIALTLNDFIYEQYKLEEEDFMKSVTDQMLLSNPEVANIFKEMEQCIITLMMDCGIITEDMAKVIQMQSQNIQNNVGDLGQNPFAQNPMGGVLPGSNPIELLQNQQRHQFDQMQKGKK